MQPTPFEGLSRPLRAKLGLEDIVYQTPSKYIPPIEDKRLRLIIERINREYGSKLLDQSSIGYPYEDLPFWKELSPRYRGMISRTINTLMRNGMTFVGQVRGSSLEDLMTFRNMGAIQTAVAMRMYAPFEEV